jgi:hypothetical protein
VDLLVARFEKYFRHHIRSREVLERGDKTLGCLNVRRALECLGIDIASGPPDESVYDADLENAVRQFQQRFEHWVEDGRVGPNTRQRLVRKLLEEFDPSIFHRLKAPGKPSVFLSYARADLTKVRKLDQWLRDHKVYVIRDDRSFEVGTGIDENIRQAVATADKVVAVLSKNSRDRDWPRLERSVAEELESRLGHGVLIYLKLDDTSLPAHDATRLAIDATDVPLKDVGTWILHALKLSGLEPESVSYDENEPL